MRAWRRMRIVTSLAHELVLILARTNDQSRESSHRTISNLQLRPNHSESEEV